MDYRNLRADRCAAQHMLPPLLTHVAATVSTRRARSAAAVQAWRRTMKASFMRSFISSAPSSCTLYSLPSQSAPACRHVASQLRDWAAFLFGRVLKQLRLAPTALPRPSPADMLLLRVSSSCTLGSLLPHKAPACGCTASQLHAAHPRRCAFYSLCPPPFSPTCRHVIAELRRKAATCSMPQQSGADMAASSCSDLSFTTRPSSPLCRQAVSQLAAELLWTWGCRHAPYCPCDSCSYVPYICAGDFKAVWPAASNDASLP